MRGKIKLSLSGYASVLNDTIVIMTHEAFLLCTYLIVPINNRTLTFFKGKFKLTQFEGISMKKPLSFVVLWKKAQICYAALCAIVQFSILISA